MTDFAFRKSEKLWSDAKKLEDDFEERMKTSALLPRHIVAQRVQTRSIAKSMREEAERLYKEGK